MYYYLSERGLIMKKIISVMTAFATALSLLCSSAYAASSDITLYNTDGETKVVTQSELEENLNNSWYLAPVVTMYDLNGETTVVAEENIEEWKGYGWYLAPVIMMYDYRGNTTVVAKDNIEEWKGYGWSETPVSKEAYYVNQKGLSSQTEYLIWVSKSEFKVRVFRGSKGNWNLINSLTCAIGKPSTPTCEGTYKYYQAQKMWDYGSYYVGPIMRFNGGYAIHSTLIYKNGTPKDNRVGMKLSLGCVRLQPQDINWLFSTIPLYTTIHITG